jgi:hypothetical protein
MLLHVGARVALPGPCFVVAADGGSRRWSRQVAALGGFEGPIAEGRRLERHLRGCGESSEVTAFPPSGTPVAWGWPVGARRGAGAPSAGQRRL